MKATYQSSDGGAGSEPPSWLLEDEEVELSTGGGGGGGNSNSSGGNSGNNSETGVRGTRSSKYGSSSSISSSNVREDNSGALMDDLIDCYCCHIDLSILSLQFFHIACISLALMSSISNAYEVTHKVGDGPVDFRDKMIRGFGVLLSIIGKKMETFLIGLFLYSYHIISLYFHQTTHFEVLNLYFQIILLQALVKL